jgi:uncharacterized protein GlcG (DUF336 family)
MRSFPVLLLTALAVSFPAAAQDAPPGLTIAREAATAAVVACEQLGFRTMATVVDDRGRPVAAMAADPQLARLLASGSVRSARIAAYFHDSSSDIQSRITEEPQVFHAIHDQPQLSPIEPGGMPFPGPETLGPLGIAGVPNSDGLGAVGVAGARNGDADEECARDGVLAVLAKLSSGHGQGHVLVRQSRQHAPG